MPGMNDLDDRLNRALGRIDNLEEVIREYLSARGGGDSEAQQATGPDRAHDDAEAASGHVRGEEGDGGQGATTGGDSRDSVESGVAAGEGGDDFEAIRKAIGDIVD